MAKMTNREIINNAVQLAISIANDNSHGYSQARRNGPDFDCSSLVLYCYKKAGANINGATYTGNMREKLGAAGWEILPKNTALKAGDILLNDACHTAIYIGDGKIVEATLDENGGITGPKQGDQTGHEIHIRNYYKYSAGWNCVLRLPDSAEIKQELEQFVSCYIPVTKRGDVSPAVCAIQSALNYHGFGPLACDGVFGPETETAVLNFQRVHGLKRDGIVGAETMHNILIWR